MYMYKLEPLVAKRLFQCGLALNLIVISWLAFSESSPQVSISGNDKLLHALAFFVLAFLVDGAFLARSFVSFKMPLLISYGLFIELVQLYLSYREFSLLDLVADATGILCFWVVAKPVRGLVWVCFVRE